MWIIYLILASICSVFTNMQLSQIKEFSWELIKLVPFALSVNFLYWLSFSKSPSFIICFIFSILFASVIGVMCDIFIMKSVTYSLNFIIGTVLILCGVIILKL